MTEPKQNNIWERQEGESSKAWEAFKKYRGMGLTRSFSKVAQDYLKPTSKRVQLTKWSSTFKWVKRCESYDAYEDEILLKENEAELKKMGKRHAKLAKLMQDKGEEKLKALNAMEMKHLNATDAVRLITEGMKFERLARGESTENQQHSITFEDNFMEALNAIRESKPNSGQTEASAEQSD